MFLKQLIIKSDDKIIRDIHFHEGLNLIVDESTSQVTGNNVGKTTVLKLIDFCLGGKAKNIYADTENPKNEDSFVKDFLINNNVIITLIVGADFGSAVQDICIRRNFMTRKKAIYEIDGTPFTNIDEFIKKLATLFFPNLESKKPTFRQLVSHNIRYKDDNISNMLKTLGNYARDVDYEAMYLYLFECYTENSDKRRSLLKHISEEKKYKKRLAKNKSKNDYQATLDFIESNIEKLDRKKALLNINENFEEDLNKLNRLKYSVNSLSSKISALNTRKNILLDAQRDLESQKATIDIEQLNAIYSQATSLIPNIQKKFDELVAYHNAMLTEKSQFITQDLPLIEEQIAESTKSLEVLLEKERSLSLIIKQSDTFEELESIIHELNEEYRKKGECETIISELEAVDKKINEDEQQLEIYSEVLFSDQFEQKIAMQLKKFNHIFAQLSNQLYGESYSISYEKVMNKDNQPLYKFKSIQVSQSSGLKQGEISCFDIAYILFAEQENIPCLHFVLNDKKELVHDNQLNEIAEIVQDKKVQFVASILRDKLPNDLNNDDYFVLSLSQEDKLFRIESFL